MSAMENSDQLWEIEAAPEAGAAPMALFLIPILGFFLWVAEGLTPLWDRRRQAYHDKIAGSMVVNAAR